MPHFETEYEQKLYNDRLASLEKIRAIGQRLGLTAAEAAYPNTFPFTYTLAELRDAGDSLSAEQLEATPVEAAIAGRIMAIRGGFAVLQQGGDRLQIYVHKDMVGPDLFELYKALHIGDHIGVRGSLMRTRTGELTLKAQPVQLAGHEEGKPLTFLAKALLALPDKYYGLEDIEARYRQRYVDLIMNSGNAPKAAPANAQQQPSDAPDAPETEARNVRETFVKRAAVLRAIRKFFDKRGYLEVETPMLHTVAGGAAARPFTTHHNALDIPLSLRIAPELFLKRLVVGGLDRVYEINRNFRNEGVSTRHNPEFTMLEFYQAYANYHDLMELTQELIKFVAMEVNGSYITHFNGAEIDLSKWQKLSMREAIVKFWDENRFGARPSLDDFQNTDSLIQLLDRANSAFNQWSSKTGRESDEAHSRTTVGNVNVGTVKHRDRTAEMFSLIKIDLKKQIPAGKAIAGIFEAIAEPHLIQPTIIYDFPLAVSPLSKVKPDEPDWVERFEFYIGGFEVGNAFSELNDMADQEARFQAQVADKDPESMAEVDEDYVRALGYGLPPTAGEGIGIDRLTMVLTGAKSIRDVILFPLMRPQGASANKPADDLAASGGESAE